MLDGGGGSCRGSVRETTVTAKRWTITHNALGESDDREESDADADDKLSRLANERALHLVAALLPLLKLAASNDGALQLSQRPISDLGAATNVQLANAAQMHHRSVGDARAACHAQRADAS